MKLVFLDRKTIGEDLDLSPFEEFGEVVMYPFSTPEEVPERVKDADVIILNKVPINETTIGGAEKLKLVCVTATGTNNLDKDYLERAGIAWRNVAGYSTESVAQHTFAMLFYLYENLSYYDSYVKQGRYINDKMFTHFDSVFLEISGKKWGIIGLGAIGKRVAEIASCFGCQVQYYSTSGKNHNPDFREVDFDTLLRTSDIVSIPNIRMAKPIRIIVEEDLKYALEHHLIQGAGLDVLDVEPMSEDHPLKDFKDSGRLLITPHIAWASVEARTHLMDIIYHQIKEFWSR